MPYPKLYKDKIIHVGVGAMRDRFVVASKMPTRGIETSYCSGKVK